MITVLLGLFALSPLLYKVLCSNLLLDNCLKLIIHHVYTVSMLRLDVNGPVVTFSSCGTQKMNETREEIVLCKNPLHVGMEL